MPSPITLASGGFAGAFSAAGAVGPVRISGCRMSPPMLAAQPIRPKVTTAAIRVAASVRWGNRESRWRCHNPSHASAPVNSMTPRASHEAFSCMSIIGTETSGVCSNANRAAEASVGIDSRAIPKKDYQAGALQMILLVMRATRNRPSPRIIPTVGK